MANKLRTTPNDDFGGMIDSNDNEQTQQPVKRTTDPKTWQQRFNLAYRNQRPLFKKMAEWYELMYAIKTYQNISVWKSQVFIPVMSYKAWTIIAKLISLRPGFSVKLFDELYSDDDRLTIEKANLKLEYDYDNPMLDESIRDKTFDTLCDAVICGTGFGKAEWASGKRTSYTHFQKRDGTIDYTKSNKEVSDYGYNDLNPVNVMDVFPQPGKRSFEKKRWIIVKCPRLSRDELIESGLYDESVVKSLKTLGKGKDTITTYKQSRNQFIGETQADQESLDDTVDAFDLYECYERTNDGIYLMTFAEAANEGGQNNTTSSTDKAPAGENNNSQWYEIRNEKQPYWHSKYPLVPAYIRRRPHDAWGESIFEITESMANAYNDVFNQLADNLAIVGNGGILLHETGTTIYDFYYAPGGEIRYSGNPPSFVRPDTPDLDIFTTMFNLLESGVTNATVSNYATGTPSDQTDKTQGTATGINLLQEASGEITAFMKSGFMQFVKGVGQRWLSNNRQFFDDTLTVKSKVHGQSQVLRITSEDFNDHMVLTVDEAMMEPSTKQQRLQNTVAWLNSTIQIQNQSLIQAGIAPPAKGTQPIQPPTDATGQPIVKPFYVDYGKIFREVSEEYDKPDADQFIIDDTNPNSGNQQGHLTDLIAAIKQNVKDGDVDAATGQQLIDALEGRLQTPGASQGVPNAPIPQVPAPAPAVAGAAPSFTQGPA